MTSVHSTYVMASDHLAAMSYQFLVGGGHDLTSDWDVTLSRDVFCENIVPAAYDLRDSPITSDPVNMGRWLYHHM